MIKRLTAIKRAGWICAAALLTAAWTGCGELNEWKDERLGLTAERLDPQLEDRWGAKGVAAAKVPPNSELEPGDLITHLAARYPVSSEGELEAALKRAMAPQKRFWQIGAEDRSDASALLEVERDGETIYIELAARKPSEWKRHGAAFSGTQVSSVRAGYESSQSLSPAEAAGVEPGDRVAAVIDEDAVESVKAFKKAAERAKNAAQVYVYTHELAGIKIEAIRAVGQLGADSPKALDRLLAIMEREKDPAVRRTAARALEALAPSQKDKRLLEAALRRLSEAHEPDVEIRRSAASMIESLSKTLGAKAFDENAVASAAAAMKDSDPGVQLQAGVVLSRLGERSLPALRSALRAGASLRVQDIAASALGEIGGNAARQELINALRSAEDVTLQLTIATALAKVGETQQLRAFLQTSPSPGVEEFVRQLVESPDS